MRFFSRLRDILFDFLFPKSRRVLELESLSVTELLKRLPEAETSQLDENITALFDYSHSLVKEIVWEVKYAGNEVLASKLGTILWDSIVEVLNEKNIFAPSTSLGASKHKIIFMPMPISDRRRYERGWNQAELLAQAVKSNDGANILKYLPHQLVKFRHTESQTRTADKSERRRNLADSMKVQNPLSVAGECVVLVDDVVTTGSTFAEAKRALREAGAKKIICFAVAH